MIKCDHISLYLNQCALQQGIRATGVLLLLSARPRLREHVSLHYSAATLPVFSCLLKLCLFTVFQCSWLTHHISQHLRYPAISHLATGSLISTVYQSKVLVGVKTVLLYPEMILKVAISSCDISRTSDVSHQQSIYNPQL